MANAHEPGPIDAKGAFFDDFLLTDHLPPETAPVAIERDRPVMSARPGFDRKLLPLRVEPETHVAYCGGRYLFDTYENAVAFGNWVKNDFVIDGTPFMEQPSFANITAEYWHVAGAHDFKDVRREQTAMRVERFALSPGQTTLAFRNQYEMLRDRAKAAGYASFWLLYREDPKEIALVTVTDRLASRDRSAPDFATVKTLEAKPSLGGAWENEAVATKVFDRVSWILTVWFPRRGRADDEEAVWPNSPPLPAPKPAGVRAAE